MLDSERLSGHWEIQVVVRCRVEVPAVAGLYWKLLRGALRGWRLIWVGGQVVVDRAAVVSTRVVRLSTFVLGQVGLIVAWNFLDQLHPPVASIAAKMSTAAAPGPGPGPQREGEPEAQRLPRGVPSCPVRGAAEPRCRSGGV